MSFSKTLFKKTRTGADQIWKIWTEGPTIVVEWGQVGGAQQQTRDVIKEGKNIGKSNATTPEQQAEAEATATWVLKKKKGYVDSLDDAQAGKLDESIKGGIWPMLAYDFKKVKGFKFPCYGQPKMDGDRCIGEVKPEGSVLWSRTRKPELSIALPHLVEILDETFSTKESFFLDGETYTHALHDDFDTLRHLNSQKKEAAEGHEVVQYHIYDLPGPGTFKERHEKLKKLIPSNHTHLILVETVEIANEEAAIAYMGSCIERGYEGAMLRSMDGLYESIGPNGRSKGLLKLKLFDDAEFLVIGWEEGKGAYQGSIGAFVCKTDAGVVFKAKLRGKGVMKKMREWFPIASSFIGQPLTVKFQGYTPDGSLRFPVALRFRPLE